MCHTTCKESWRRAYICRLCTCNDACKTNCKIRQDSFLLIHKVQRHLLKFRFELGQGNCFDFLPWGRTLQTKKEELACSWVLLKKLIIFSLRGIYTIFLVKTCLCYLLNSKIKMKNDSLFFNDLKLFNDKSDDWYWKYKTELFFKVNVTEWAVI